MTESKILDFPIKDKIKDRREKMVFELKRIADLIESDEADPQVEYLILSFKQGDDIIVGGVGIIPGSDRAEIHAALKDGFDKWDKMGNVTDI